MQASSVHRQPFPPDRPHSNPNDSNGLSGLLGVLAELMPARHKRTKVDGERIPVKPMTAIFIKPGCRHRAVGRMHIINVPIPAFDPADEWFD